MRLFIAVNLPAEERRAIWQATAPLRASHLPVRWVGESELHVTLRFLGEVESERAPAIAEALAGAVGALQPFGVGVGGVGAFPGLAKPRVIWLGVERHPALELLANDVELALMGLGFEPALKPFAPHLTLGRARRGARPAALKDLARLAGAVTHQALAPVTSVDLMQSTLGAQGASYTVLSKAALGRGPAAAAQQEGEAH